MEVACDGPAVAIDRPLVVVENHDQPVGLLGDIVQRFKRDAVGESSIAGDGNDVLVATREVAGHSHSKRGRKRCSCVAGSVAVVLAFGAQRKAVQAARLANRAKLLAASGEDLVRVYLMADVPD